MSGKRVFLGWARPALLSAAEQLISRSSSSQICDLSHVIVVLPGREAGRRLMERLAELAGGGLIPPRILTQGGLPEELYPPQRPFASELVQQMVWAQALQEVSSQTLSNIVRHPPEKGDWQGWMRLGNLLRRQHEELAADQLNFSDVATLGNGLEGFDEAPRWQALGDVQQAYWKGLDQLELWDRQTARLVAIQRHECRTESEIVTIGAVDLNRTLRAMLKQVSDRVTVLIDAPEEWGDRFDEFGCLRPEQWADQTVDLAPEQLTVVEESSAQVDAILDVLAQCNGKYSLEDISIGVPDERLVPQIQRTLQAEGIPTHWPVDCALDVTAPYSLLNAVADYLEERRTSSFSAFIRHPDVTRWISRSALRGHDWLTLWDQHVGTALSPTVPSTIEALPRPEPSPSLTTQASFAVGESEELPDELLATEPSADQSRFRLVWELITAVNSLVSPFESRSIPLSRLGEPVREFFLAVYGNRIINPRDVEQARLQKSLVSIQQSFDSLADLPPSLDQSLSAVEGVRLVLSQTGGDLYQTASQPSIHVAGWLEMPLDDAPVAIVTTFNEGFVPSSVNHDLFLPNRLRSHLGLEDNARRYARDLCNLTCMVHSRAVLRIIVARRDVLNEPLAPSRLLFATDEEQIPQRVVQFYSHSRPASRSRQVGHESRFRIPRPTPRQDLPGEFRVTEFRDYLASPYRYYLRYVLRLNEISDAVTELDGRAFGNLVHDVLSEFGQSEVRHATQDVEIASFLHEQLSRSILKTYGTSPLASVLIQVEQARRRLTAFAEWQAEWRRDGWRIEHVEIGGRVPVPFPLEDGRPAFLKGRIDRIDFHPRHQSWALFDYKTGDSGMSPEKTHRDQGAWCDLQLPLYRHLARHLEVTGDVRLGYIVLPRDTNAVKAEFGNWSADELAEADDVARDVIRDVLEERFWKILDEPPWSLTEFDAICQAGVFGQEAIV